MNFGTEVDEKKTAEINSVLNKDLNDSSVARAIDKIEEGVKVSDVRTTRTDFDADLTEEEKREALLKAKEEQMKKVEKQAKNSQRALKQMVFLRTHGLKALAYILHVLSAVFNISVYIAIPMFAVKLTSKLFKSTSFNGRVPIATTIVNKIVAFNNSREAKNKLSDKKNKTYLDTVISLCLFALGLSIRLFVFAVIVFAYGFTLMILMDFPLGFIVVLFFLVSVVNSVVGFDKKMYISACNMQENKDSYIAENMGALEEETKAALTEIEERDIEGMTEREKMNYLKSTGKLERKETVEHQNNYNNYY